MRKVGLEKMLRFLSMKSPFDTISFVRGSGLARSHFPGPFSVGIFRGLAVCFRGLAFWGCRGRDQAPFRGRQFSESSSVRAVR